MKLWGLGGDGASAWERGSFGKNFMVIRWGWGRLYSVTV